MHDYLMEMLECPACHGELTWTVMEHRGDCLETAEAQCRACAALYPIQEGIGVFLTPDLARRDLWEQRESWLTQYLREHPDIERQLMQGTLEDLAPADRSIRAGLLVERGEYDQAKIEGDLAWRGLHTPEHVSCTESQVKYAIEKLAEGDGPIVDLASGMGSLVQEMAGGLSRPIVATDFSPTVLRNSRGRLEHLGLYDQITLVALDARRTPFRDGAVETMTTHQGLPNITEPGELLRELRRVVGGAFLAISLFYPEDDEGNAAAIRDLKLETLLYRRVALEGFAAAGWEVEVANAQSAKTGPTPTSVLLEGAKIDGMPVCDTVLEFCVLVAR